MEFRVINGELRVNRFDILFVANAATVLVGEIEKVSLSTAFETPPERLIDAVTTPLVPLVSSFGRRGG